MTLNLSDNRKLAASLPTSRLGDGNPASRGQLTMPDPSGWAAKWEARRIPPVTRRPRQRGRGLGQHGAVREAEGGAADFKQAGIKEAVDGRHHAIWRLRRRC